jgi:ribosomal-protein-alanine N-acetyltransferase
MNNHFALIESERLKIQPMSELLYEDWYYLSQDEGIIEYQISNYRMNSLEDSKKWILEKQDYFKKYNFGIFSVHLKSSNKLIGISGLKDINVKDQSEIELMYRLAKPFWGHGFGTEIAKALIEYAKNHLNLKKIVATVDPNNVTSKKILKKSNFKFIKKIHILGIEEEFHELVLNDD